jgi:uncharacterized protein YjhX (UPF0386 family)
VIRPLTKNMRTVLENVRDDRRADNGMATLSSVMKGDNHVRVTPVAAVFRALRKRGYLRQTSDASYKITQAGLDALNQAAKQQ